MNLVCSEVVVSLQHHRCSITHRDITGVYMCGFTAAAQMSGDVACESSGLKDSWMLCAGGTWICNSTCLTVINQRITDRRGASARLDFLDLNALVFPFRIYLSSALQKRRIQSGIPYCFFHILIKKKKNNTYLTCAHLNIKYLLWL